MPAIQISKINAPKPAPLTTKLPHLRLVPGAPAKRDPLVPLSAKTKVRLHPDGCRCAYHRPYSPWGIPNDVKPGTLPLLAGPSVVLWDIENWQGGPRVDPLALARDFRFTRSLLGLTASDHIILGMSHFTANRCLFALPTNRTAIVLGSGPDGADKKLIEAVVVAQVARHFRRLVVISNDHIFTPLAKSAAMEGMTTWNVSSDLSAISAETRKAYSGWTHLKLRTVRERADGKSNPRNPRRAGGRRDA